MPTLLLAGAYLFSTLVELGTEPLINRPFCPDNTILDWFSGSFAHAHYQRSQGILMTQPLYP
jgi:hypothetical protein